MVVLVGNVATWPNFYVHRKVIEWLNLIVRLLQIRSHSYDFHL